MEPNPIDQGYRMPAEWERHSATWLTWPQNKEYWQGEAMVLIEAAYILAVQELSTGEHVNILANDEKNVRRISQLLIKERVSTSHVSIHIVPTKDIWIRDYGPNFLIPKDLTKPVRMNRWLFNSWGNKYEMEDDKKVATSIANKLNIEPFQPNIVLEGGAIEVNGQGLCLTTEECLLNKNRNDGPSKATMESYLKNFLGILKVIWCKGGMEGDDTDGHIDNLARFVSPDTVVCVYEEDQEDPNYQNLKVNFEVLQNSTNQNGNPLKLVKLPTPGYVGENSLRYPASYANFYIGNDVVIVPSYDHPNDNKVCEILKPFFPNRKIVKLSSNTLITGNGGIHCATQQQPSLNF
jgi:agmatine deiminase